MEGRFNRIDVNMSLVWSLRNNSSHFSTWCWSDFTWMELLRSLVCQYRLRTFLVIESTEVLSEHCLKSPRRSCVHTVTVHEVLDEFFLNYFLFCSIWSNLWHLNKLMPISPGIGELSDHSNYRELVVQSILFQGQLNSWQFLWLDLPRYQKNNQRLWILS